MKDKNVCKFISEPSPSNLRTAHFIFESNAEHQKMQLLLKQHRMYLISRGEGVFRFGTIETPVTVGDMLFGFPGETPVAEGSCLEYFYIGFEGQRTAELYRRFGVTNLTRKFSGHESLIPFWRENITRATDENLDVVSECALMYAFSKLRDVRTAVEDIPLLMATYADEHFSDGDLSLGSLASDWGYNPKYLSGLFKNRMGIGFSHYLKTLRMKHAVLLMEHGVESVKNVAFLCGFHDPLYFSKTFREQMGCSPKEYLRRRSAAE